MKKCQPPVPDSRPPASLRSLVLQTHLELIAHFQDPLICPVNDQITESEFWEFLLEATREANHEQGTVK